MLDAQRKRASLTADAERKALQAMARAIPPSINSDHLTVIGVVGAIGVGAGYALSVRSPHWLWLASAMLVVNWFGDSLDGTLARVRGTERPRYGYYLDHGIDAFTTAIIGSGIALSPFVPLEIALVLVLLYLIMSIMVYLEAHVYGVFRMDFGWIGPTEVRILLIGVNALLVFLITGLEVPARHIRTTATLVLSAAATGMLGLLLWRFIRNLRHLSRLEPLHRGETVGPAPAGDDPGGDDVAEAGPVEGGRTPGRHEP